MLACMQSCFDSCDSEWFQSAYSNEWISSPFMGCYVIWADLSLMEKVRLCWLNSGPPHKPRGLHHPPPSPRFWAAVTTWQWCGMTADDKSPAAVYREPPYLQTDFSFLIRWRQICSSRVRLTKHACGRTHTQSHTYSIHTETHTYTHASSGPEPLEHQILPVPVYASVSTTHQV